MRKSSTKKRSVLQRQAISPKRKQKRFFLSFRVFGSFCKGLSKIFAALLALALISFSFLSIYHYVLASPYLKLEHVKIRGVEEPLKGQLLEMSGLNPDTSLLALNLHALKKKLEQHPWIRSIQLERKFPHTLVIRAERQEPRAILLGDGMYYLNRFGEAFKKVGLSEDTDFPLVTGLKSKKSPLQGKLDEVARVMEELHQEKRPWSLADLAEIHVEDGDVFTLYFEHMDAGIRINARALRKEMRELRRVVAHLAHSGRIGEVRAINFIYAGGAVVSFKKG